MKKNHDLHFVVEKELKIKIQEESTKLNISLAEYCRKKLRENSQLDRIEEKVEKLLKR